MRNITIGLEVNFVDSTGKSKKAKVVEVFSEGAVRLDLGKGGGSAQAQYSAGKEPGTFHFADEAQVSTADVADNADKEKPNPFKSA